MSDLIEGLSRALDVASQRQQLVAANMANIDTPHYRTRDLADFSGALQQALAAPRDGGETAAEEISGLIERPDGNNVSLERETLAMSDTQMHYRMAAQMLRAQFHLLSTALDGGHGA